MAVTSQPEPHVRLALWAGAAHDYSPGLTIANTPKGTVELALSMVDVKNQKIHWLQVGIPAATRELKAHHLTPGARELLNNLGEATYDGPCPRPNSTHPYRLTLYACGMWGSVIADFKGRILWTVTLRLGRMHDPTGAPTPVTPLPTSSPTAVTT
ncbi:YbhB/YbcL family Raf kinase inhibitor-like protein [Streptomyces camelliae]|uniref:YbhB/YbcL family Raf kinase inhibitor-like protein n=1 Tax=Streptomyces camelliae TaxID=3004093 RepID=A0ABY7PHS8_9ACTN|nr:hypothetical protein [Streptomyces sp. HUAS 2-6]WBO67923.1 hypothetical protein O1G22_36450 [Streptomyces sp. HUAS 2-6]